MRSNVEALGRLVETLETSGGKLTWSELNCQYKEECIPWCFAQRTGEVTCVARRQFLDGGRSERGLESTF